MKRKGHITEGDVALLLRRYSASTVLSLLQEVSKCANRKIDWNTLVKNTATGITNAREYQMLWHHLAYCAILPDIFEDDAQLLDDDSDLDFEIEPSPPVGAEALAEAAACVKVLEASGIPKSSGQPSHSIVEAPLTINIPSSAGVSDVHANNQQAAISAQGMNITVPVSIQRQPLPTVSSSEGIDGNISSSVQPVRKKRKLWTAEEDKELIAAVQKCGEGNWASIVKGAFNYDRTASQLSQRWSLIRKRKVVSSQGNLGNSSTLSGAVDSLQSAAQVVPVAVSTTSGMNVTATVGPTITVTSNSTGATAVTVPCSSPILPMASTGSGMSLNQLTAGTGSDNSALQLSKGHQGEQGPAHGIAGSSSVCPTLASVKIRPKTKKQAANKSSTGRLIGPMPPPAITAATASVSTPAKTAVSLPAASPASGRYGNALAAQPGIGEALGHVSSKTLNGPHPMVQAAAVAAGARIAPASAAASLLKAAQSGNVVHFGVGGVQLAKSGYSTQAGTACGTTDRASNVHYIRTGSVPSPPVYSGVMPSVQRLPASQPKGHTAKAATTGQSIPQSPRTNLLPGTTLSSKQALESSGNSQAQVLNQTNQANVSPFNTSVLYSKGKLKSQTGPYVTEVSQTVQSDLHLKPPASETIFTVPPTSTATADQVYTEQAASVSPKASVLPPAVEISCEVSSSLLASNSSGPVVGPSQLTNVPTAISSIPIFSDNVIVNDVVTEQEDKTIELKNNQSSSTTSVIFQHLACSERSMFGENAAGFECDDVKATIEVDRENENGKNIEIKATPESPSPASHQNVSSSAQHAFSNDPSVENGK